MKITLLVTLAPGLVFYSATVSGATEGTLTPTTAYDLL